MAELSPIYTLLTDLQGYLNNFVDNFSRVAKINLSRPKVYLGNCHSKVTENWQKHTVQHVKLTMNTPLIEAFVLADIQDKLDNELIKWSRNNQNLKSKITQIDSQSQLTSITVSGITTQGWELSKEFDLFYESHLPLDEPENPNKPY